MTEKKNNELIDCLLSLKTKEEMEAFLRGILTPQEYAEMPRRLEIFKMLHAGIPQHEIAKKIGVGIATVTRGSQEIKRGQIQKTSWWQNLSFTLGG